MATRNTKPKTIQYKITSKVKPLLIDSKSVVLPISEVKTLESFRDKVLSAWTENKPILIYKNETNSFVILNESDALAFLKQEIFKLTNERAFWEAYAEQKIQLIQEDFDKRYERIIEKMAEPELSKPWRRFG